MSNLESMVDRFEVEALRGEFTDAAMMRDSDRLASLFTQGGVVRIPTSTSNSPAGGRSAPGKSGYWVSGTTTCKTHTRA